MKNTGIFEQWRWLYLGFFFLGGGLMACEPRQDRLKSASADNHDPAFQRAYKVIVNSCMPCHNRHSLPDVVARVRQAQFKEAEGETRLRILAELEGLQEAMNEGTPFSFTSREELLKFFNAAPGELYTMVEKGIMPPSWAAPLMKQLKLPYVPLTPDNRALILKFAKPYSEKYL